MNEQEFLKKIQELIDGSTKGLITEKELNARVEALNKELKTLNEKPNNHEEVKALKDKVDGLITENARLAGEVNAIKEEPRKVTIEKPLSPKDAFKKALIDAVIERSKDVPTLLTEKVDDEDKTVKTLSMRDYFKKLGNKQTPEMVVKVAVDMLESSIVQSNVATVRMTELDPNRVGIPLTVYGHVTDWMPVKGITKKYMSVLVVYSYEDGAGTQTEGSAPTQSSFLLKTVEFVSANIATYFTLSDQSLDDLPEAMEEIAIVGPSKIKDNIDSQILGSAGNDTTTIKGLYAATKHTDFTGSTTYADTIQNANKVDVIATMKLQCETAKYLPDTVILHPQDVVEIAAEKDQLDNSKTDRRVAFNAIGEPVAICGLVIRKNPSQTANTVTVLRNDQVQIGDRRQMTMEIGYNGTDFTEFQKTVRISVRLAFAVRDSAAVIYCDDLDTAVADIKI